MQKLLTSGVALMARLETFQTTLVYTILHSNFDFIFGK